MAVCASEEDESKAQALDEQADHLLLLLIHIAFFEELLRFKANVGAARNEACGAELNS